MYKYKYFFLNNPLKKYKNGYPLETLETLLMTYYVYLSNETIGVLRSRLETFDDESKY